MNEKPKPLLVELLNPPLDDPWRTRGDYLEDQRHQMWQFRFTIAALVFSIIASVSAVVSAYAAVNALSRVQATACTK